MYGVRTTSNMAEHGLDLAAVIASTSRTLIHIMCMPTETLSPFAYVDVGMGDETPVFLTDERRDVLNGDYDGKANTERTHKSRIRSRSKTALHELTEMAKSPHIDHTEVLKPDDVFQFLRAILTPDHTHHRTDEFGGLSDPDATTEDFENYSNAMYVQLNKFIAFRHSNESSD